MCGLAPEPMRLAVFRIVGGQALDVADPTFLACGQGWLGSPSIFWCGNGKPRRRTFAADRIFYAIAESRPQLAGAHAVELGGPRRKGKRRCAHSAFVVKQYV